VSLSVSSPLVSIDGITEIGSGDDRMVSRGARFDGIDRFGDANTILDAGDNDLSGREDDNDSLSGREVGKLLGRLSICSLGPI
jgi:hypothetical protein